MLSAKQIWESQDSSIAAASCPCDNIAVSRGLGRPDFLQQFCNLKTVYYAWHGTRPV